ncbi:MAG: hypothetical protein KAI66_03915 [Lentisphaeria bacterium]|nr:hypothetical protein [Lentisphaeria bacterium]
MKFLFVLILMILGVVAYFLLATPEAPPPAKPKTQTEKVAKTDPSHHARDDSTIVENINTAVGGAMGYNQVMAKNKVHKKLDKIQRDHNKALGGE